MIRKLKNLGNQTAFFLDSMRSKYYLRLYATILVGHAWLVWNVFTPAHFNAACSPVLMRKAEWCFRGMTGNVFLFVPDAVVLGFLFWTLHHFHSTLKAKGPYNEGWMIGIIPAYMAFRLFSLSPERSAFLSDHYYVSGVVGSAVMILAFVALVIRNMERMPSRSDVVSAPPLLPEAREEKSDQVTGSEEAFQADVVRNVKNVLPSILQKVVIASRPLSSAILLKTGGYAENALSIKDVRFIDPRTVFAELSLHDGLFAEIEELRKINWTLNIESRGKIKNLKEAKWSSSGGENGIMLTIEEYSIDMSKTFDYPYLLENNPNITHALDFILGKDRIGNTPVFNLGKMPHLLIGGTTGGGKSVGTNDMIISYLKNILAGFPIDKMILIDPKIVEFAPYENLFKVQVITEIDKAANALAWACAEMQRRYQVLKQNKSKNIGSFQKKGGKMGYIIIVIDELSDLMMTTSTESNVENNIVRLLQKARACGIHLMLATQRPSVDVITGLIKTNAPSRLGFKTASKTDSRIIVDAPDLADLMMGEAKLFTATGITYLKTFFVDDNEGGDLEKFVEYYRSESLKFQSDMVRKAPTRDEADMLQATFQFDIPEIEGPLVDLDNDEFFSSDDSEDCESSPLVDSSSKTPALSPMESFLATMRESDQSFDEFSASYAIFRYLIENDGYKNRKDFRDTCNVYGISVDSSDKLMKSLKVKELVAYDDARKYNFLSEKAATIDVRAMKTLYESIYQVIGK